ncbi:MAG: PAS domain S-box protein [Candidatus Zixiibacteriota bacterium]
MDYSKFTKQELIAEILHLEENEKKLLYLIESMTFGIVFQDKSGIIISANKMAEKILGLSLQQMQGRKSTDPRWKSIREDGSSFPGEEHPAMIALKTAEKVHNVKMGVKKPGNPEITWININAVPLFRDGENEPYQVYSTFEDVTQTVNFQKGLQKSQKIFELFMKHLPGAVFLKNQTGKLLFANATFAKLIGKNPEEIIGKNIDRMLNPKNVEAFAEENRKIILNRQPIVSEHEFTWQGNTSHFYNYKFPIELKTDFFDMQQNILIGSISIDITDLKQMQNALVESEEKYRNLVEHTPQGICTIDDKGIYIFMNEAAAKALGGLPNDFIGKKMNEIFPEEIANEQLSEIHKTIEKGKYHQTIKRSYVAGEYRWFEARMQPLQNDEDHFDRVLLILTDVTEIRKAEKEREELRAKLQRAQKMEALGTLAGGVAHDLNNILSGIVGYPEILMMDIEDLKNKTSNYLFLEKLDDIHKTIDMINNSGQRAANVVHDLLTLARRGVNISKPVNINDIVKYFIHSPEYAKILKENPGIEVETRLNENTQNIIGSKAHLNKTLLNLVLNAFEAMHKTGTIKIETRNQTIIGNKNGYEIIPEGSYSLLIVKDEGTGIKDEDLERIFEPFYTRKIMGRSGTGLGMAIVWGTVKDHNGYIDIDTKIGYGSTFTIYLPVSDQDIKNDNVPESKENLYGKGQKILIVDDIEAQRKLASDILSRFGYETITASSGEEAIEKSKKQKFDLVILDMIMNPGIDGLDTYKILLEINPEQKIIIASGYSENDRVKKALELGASKYIRKPYSIMQLVKDVKESMF